MDAYSHLRVLVSLILGLAITRVLSGLSRRLQDPGKTERMHAQIVWSLALLLGAVHFWWWEFALRLIEGWHFGVYLFVLSYASLFFLMATLLYPDHLQHHAEREEFFLRRRRAFFGIFALSFLFDLFDTSLKGQGYMALLGVGYFLRIGIGLAVAFVSMRTDDSRRLMWLGVIWLVVDIIWIANRYGALD